MTRKTPVDPAAMPTTLAAAHELLPRLMPDPTAPVSEWAAFRRRSSAIYAHIADVDRGHHHEALYWAQREREEAEALETQLGRPTQSDGGDLTPIPDEAKESQCPQM